MQRDDPLAPLEQLCHISSSQQQTLNRSRFAGEPEEEDKSLSDDDSGGIPVASTGIVMLSLPDSTDEEEEFNDVNNIPRDDDVFLTPPEESFSLPASQEQQQLKNVPVGVRGDRTAEVVADNGNLAAVDGDCMDDDRAVDLGRDADLGFSSEAEVTEQIEIDSGSQSSPGVNQISDNKVIHSDSINFRVIEGKVNTGDGLGETPTKKLKTVNNNLCCNTPERCLGSQAAETIERVAKSIEKLFSPFKNSQNLDENIVLGSSRNSSGAKTSNSLHTAKKLSFEGTSPYKFLYSLQIQQDENVAGVDEEFHGHGSAKGKLKFYSRTVESRMEENGVVSVVNEERVEGGTDEIEEESDMEDNEVVSAVNADRVEGETEREEIEDDKTDRLCNTNETSSGANPHERRANRVTKSIGDIDKFRYVRPPGESSSGKLTDFGLKRALPVSLSGNNSKAQGETVLNGVSRTSDDKKMTVFDVLRELAKKYPPDPSLAKLSALEAAKRAGMTFP